MKYMVWQLDCGVCGDVCTYGEDEDSVPENCENCGAPVDS